MGDTGSLCLGATLGCFSILTRFEVLLIVIGFVFVVETITCIIQIFYYKLTGKRLFPITPIHHSFERIGWSEKKIVKFFWFVGVVSAFVGLIIYFLFS
jgi:phospho-N-acetylmuramoyl-pentapeptide-transferase